MTLWIGIAYACVAWLVFAGLLRKHYIAGDKTRMPALAIVAMLWLPVLVLAFLFAPLLAVRLRDKAEEEPADGKH